VKACQGSALFGGHKSARGIDLKNTFHSAIIVLRFVLQFSVSFARNNVDATLPQSIWSFPRIVPLMLDPGVAGRRSKES
jgi:hypothetical protein